jgi:hypothetical protein
MKETKKFLKQLKQLLDESEINTEYIKEFKKTLTENNREFKTNNELKIYYFIVQILDILELKINENINEINTEIILKEIKKLIDYIIKAKQDLVKETARKLIKDTELLINRNRYEKDFFSKIKYDNIYREIQKALLKIRDGNIKE